MSNKNVKTRVSEYFKYNNIIEDIISERYMYSKITEDVVSEVSQEVARKNPEINSSDLDKVTLDRIIDRKERLKKLEAEKRQISRSMYSQKVLDIEIQKKKLSLNNHNIKDKINKQFLKEHLSGIKIKRQKIVNKDNKKIEEFILQVPLADLHANEGSYGKDVKWDMFEVIKLHDVILQNIIKVAKEKNIKKIIFKSLGDIIDTGIHYELLKNLTLSPVNTMRVIAEMYDKMDQTLTERGFDVEWYIVPGNHSEDREGGEKPNTMENNMDYQLGQELLFVFRHRNRSHAITTVDRFSYALPLKVGKYNTILDHQDRSKGNLIKVWMEAKLQGFTGLPHYHEFGHFHHERITVNTENSHMSIQYPSLCPVNNYTRLGYGGVTGGLVESFRYSLSTKEGRVVKIGAWYVSETKSKDVYLKAEDFFTYNLFAVELINSGERL